MAAEFPRKAPSSLVIRLGPSKKLRLVHPGRFLAVVGLVIICIIAAGFAQRQVRIVRLRREIERTKAEIRAMQMRNDELRKQIDYLNSPEYVEKMARSNLGLVMPGEYVYDVAEVKELSDPFYVPKRKTSPD